MIRRVLNSERRKQLESFLITKFQEADSYVDEFKRNPQSVITESRALPDVNEDKVPFGKFLERDYVVMMTDIRRSRDIISTPNGSRNMFYIFYTYSALVAKIVEDKFGNHGTEFLGDGVLNLFTYENLQDTLSQTGWVALEILDATSNILNPMLNSRDIQSIVIGVGISHGNCVVSRVGYKKDNDVKAFAPCIYEVSTLSKGENVLRVSTDAQRDWRYDPINGNLFFDQILVNGQVAYTATYNPKTEHAYG